MFCVIGTEEETGADGAGEVSTGVERENLVRRRLAPAAGGPRLILLRLTKCTVGVAN